MTPSPLHLALCAAAYMCLGQAFNAACGIYLKAVGREMWQQARSGAVPHDMGEAELRVLVAAITTVMWILLVASWPYFAVRLLLRGTLR
jgi:hypothetical protein